MLMTMPRRRDRIRAGVVAADSERHAVDASRFFSDALRACFSDCVEKQVMDSIGYGL